jgi:hypothetical protein
LEAKLDSTVKNFNKKVSFERKKGGGGKKHSDTKGGGKRDGDSKKDGDHPKKWPAPKTGDKKEAMFKGHMWYWCGKETGGKCEKWRDFNLNLVVRVVQLVKEVTIRLGYRINDVLKVSF